MGQFDLCWSPDTGRAGPELKIGSATPGADQGLWPRPGEGRAVPPTGCCLNPRQRDSVGPHRRAGSLPRQAQQQPSSESSRPRSRASNAPAPITPLRWLVSVWEGTGRSARVPAPRASPSIGCPPQPLTQAAGTSDRVARVLVATAGLGAVHAMEPRRTRQVTATGTRGQGGPRQPHPTPP